MGNRLPVDKLKCWLEEKSLSIFFLYVVACIAQGQGSFDKPPGYSFDVID